MGLIQPRPTFHLPAAPINGNSVVLGLISQTGATYTPTVASGSLVAFPGAQGWGAAATGGRSSGTIYRVTNLNDSGAGSFREGCEASGARYVVVTVGGTVTLTTPIQITNPNLTVCGQTAPGGGFTVKGAPVIINASNVIFRGVRVRNGTTSLSAGMWDSLAVYGPEVWGCKVFTGNPARIQTADSHHLTTGDTVTFYGTTTTPALSATYTVTVIDSDEFTIPVNVTSGQASFAGHVVPAPVTDIIIDHCSASWSIDESLTTYGAIRRLTMSWNIVAEPLRNAQHSSGSHAYGVLMGAFMHEASYHHNVEAHADQRNVRIQGNQPIEVVNNVFYDWVNWGMQVDQGISEIDPHLNIIRNYYKAGPSGSLNTRVIRLTGPFTATTELVYVLGNITPNRTTDVQTEWDCIGSSSFGVPFSTALQTLTPWPQSNYPVGSRTYAQAFYDDVLNYAGPPTRDDVDTRIVAEVRAGTGSLIDSPTDVGGWPSLASGTYPTDSNSDGIPDAWASANGMGAAAANAISPTGYSWIEEYANSLIPVVSGY